jgi:hypothetical protein
MERQIMRMILKCNKKQRNLALDGLGAAQLTTFALDRTALLDAIVQLIDIHQTDSAAAPTIVSNARLGGV